MTRVIFKKLGWPSSYNREIEVEDLNGALDIILGEGHRDSTKVGWPPCIGKSKIVHVNGEQVRKNIPLNTGDMVFAVYMFASGP